MMTELMPRELHSVTVEKESLTPSTLHLTAYAGLCKNCLAKSFILSQKSIKL